MIDLSNHAYAFITLSDIMRHKYMKGKPFVILATKTTCESVDIIDFNEAFCVDNLANELETPLLMNEILEENNFYSLFESLLWLKNCIDSQYFELQQRIKSNREEIKKLHEQKKYALKINKDKLRKKSAENNKNNASVISEYLPSSNSPLRVRVKIY